MRTGDIKRILFAMYWQNEIEEISLKETGQMDEYDVISGNITLKKNDGSVILTNINQCRLLFDAEDFPTSIRINHSGEVERYGIRKDMAGKGKE